MIYDINDLKEICIKADKTNIGYITSVNITFSDNSTYKWKLDDNIIIETLMLMDVYRELSLIENRYNNLDTDRLGMIRIEGVI